MMYIGNYIAAYALLISVVLIFGICYVRYLKGQIAFLTSRLAQPIKTAQPIKAVGYCESDEVISSLPHYILMQQKARISFFEMNDRVYVKKQNLAEKTQMMLFTSLHLKSFEEAIATFTRFEMAKSN